MADYNIQSVKQRFGIIGRSERLENALHTAIRVASTDLTVLITGESGVGKEVFSKVIHNLSPRKHNPFIAVNCGAIPEGTINSELFGHVKGAFTGATGERKGYFETVDTGTIFLDEVGEMPLDTQAYLLRILESGEFIKVGSSTVQRTDVRIIAATNVHLEKKIKEGKFREDLFYRLNTVPISVPALRERNEDTYLLFRKFVADFSEKHHIEPIMLEEDAIKWLLAYSWPGNIRELKNAAEQLSILSERRKVDAQDLLEILPQMRQRHLPSKVNTDQQENLQEREILYKLLFEMRSDLSDLKQLVFDLIKENDLELNRQTSSTLHQLNSPALSNTSNWINNDTPTTVTNVNRQEPFVIDQHANYHPPSTNEDFRHAEVVEEIVSLEDMERQMIKKALKKYKGKRRSAADELGISERTLYRKIKQYELDL